MPHEQSGRHCLSVASLQRVVADRNVFSNLSFQVQQGERLFVRGPSGVGKSLLLRVLACLDKPQAGTLQLDGHTPHEYSVPVWRSLVTYVPQSRVVLDGSPSDLWIQSQKFSSQRGRARGDLPSLLHDLGLEQNLFVQPWSTLSGGQAQRLLLAIAVALQPAILLLDEPTSACDPASVRKVERVLGSCGAGLIWVTHDPEQPHRLGGHVLDLPMGTVTALPPPTAGLSQLAGGDSASCLVTRGSAAEHGGGANNNGGGGATGGGISRAGSQQQLLGQGPATAGALAPGSAAAASGSVGAAAGSQGPAPAQGGSGSCVIDIGPGAMQGRQ